MFLLEDILVLPTNVKAHICQTQLSMVIILIFYPLLNVPSLTNAQEINVELVSSAVLQGYDRVRPDFSQA